MRETYPPDLKEIHPEDVFRTEIPGFDELFALGGIPKGNIVLVAGGPGAGKSTLCRQICNNAARRRQQCLYVSFEENVEKIERSMISFGWDVERYERERLLIIQKMNPLDILRIKFGSIEGGESATEISMKVEPITIPSDFKPDVIVIDSLTGMVASTISRARNYRIYIQQLFNFFEETRATTFLISETGEIPKKYSTTGIEEFLSDGIIVMYNIKRGSIRENALEIVKMRYTKHQKKIVAFEITDRGIEVYPDRLVSIG